MSEPTLGQTSGRNRGCMMAALVVLGLVIAYMVYVYFQYKEMPWKWANVVAPRLVEFSGGDEGQKAEDVALLKEFIQATRDGKFGGKDEGFEELVKLFAPCQAHVGFLGPRGIFETHIQKSGLSDAEKADAKHQLTLYCMAVRDDLMTTEDHQEWGKAFPKDDELGEDKQMDDKQVKAVIGKLKEILAAKKIPADTPPFDYQRELAKLLNAAREKLGKPVQPLPPASQPAATQAAATAPAK
jgi:hypothetical protein